jgi:hypothetical protein
VFCDEKNFEAFLSATQITAERLSLKEQPNGLTTGGSWKLGDYARTAALRLSLPQIRKLRSLFLDESSYLWHSEPRPDGAVVVKACIPDYGVLFTVRGGSGVLRIALCFRCDQFTIFAGEGDNPPRISEEGDFDLIRPQLLALVKQLFPEDTDIQALQPNPKT